MSLISLLCICFHCELIHSKLYVGCYGAPTERRELMCFSNGKPTTQPVDKSALSNSARLYHAIQGTKVVPTRPDVLESRCKNDVSLTLFNFFSKYSANVGAQKQRFHARALTYGITLSCRRYYSLSGIQLPRITGCKKTSTTRGFQTVLDHNVAKMVG